MTPKLPTAFACPLVVSMVVAGAGTAKENDRNDRANKVQPLFGLDEPTAGPFPSDRFTVKDQAQNTCEQVRMPLPADCVANRSTCIEIGLVNQLDGFNTRPRIAIPFDGDIDPSTVDSTSIFIVSLGDAMIDGVPDCLMAPAVAENDDKVVPRPDAGWVVGIDQGVWDPATHTLYVEAQEVLEQHTRYVVFVTRAVKDIMGEPIETPKAFKKAIGDDHDGDDAPVAPEVATYEASLRRAVAQAHFFGVKRHDIAVASVFTTVSVTAHVEKMRKAANTTPPPAPAVFTIATGGARAVFDISKITSMMYNRQFTVNGPLNPVNVGALPFLSIIPGAQTLAFFRITVPDYVQGNTTCDEPITPGPCATLVPFATHSGRPTQIGTTDVYFELILPSGTPPAGGWPVVLWGFGGSENAVGGSQLRVAAEFAAQGLATLTFNPVGFGFGPKSTVTIGQTGKPKLTFPFPGRLYDLNHNGIYDANVEGGGGLNETRILFDRDSNRQMIADVVTAIRAIEVGVDVDGDGVRDLDPDRIYWGGVSKGAVNGMLAATVEPRIKALAIASPPGFIEHQLVPSGRLITGTFLKDHVPSLLNPPGTPLITQLGGVAVTPPLFNENVPARGQPVLTNTIPGALGIQEYLERLEWLNARNAGGAYFEFLRTKPINGEARPVLIQMSRGDRTAVNPSAGYAIHAGMLEDRVTLYRHDLNPNKLVLLDPHSIFIRTDTAQLKDTAFQAQKQFADFFNSDGAITNDPDRSAPLFETPASFIPSDYGFIIP